MNNQRDPRLFPKVSVIIPTYNSASFLPEAINSVLNQTYSDFELIVVDDGSTDSTSEVLEQYQQDARVNCLFRTHTDRCTAKNIGIKKARGEVVAFLDADDIWLPDKLEKQVAFLDQNPEIAAVHGLVEMMDPRGHFLSEETFKLHKLYEKAQRRGEDYNGLTVGAVLFTSALVVRKECLDQAGYFDSQTALREDLDLCLRITQQNGRVAFLGWDPVVRYRYRGLKGHTDPAVLHAYLHIFQKNLVLLEQENLLEKYRIAYQHFLFYSADCYYLLDERKKCRKATLQAIRFNSRSIFNFQLMRHFFMSFFPIRLSTLLRGSRVNLLPQYRRVSQLQ